MIKPFPMVEKAIKELIESSYPPAVGKVGGDLSYGGSGLYFWIGLIPGGSTGRIEGEWIVDIDVFSDRYASGMDAALGLEAAIIGPRKVTSVLILDNVEQNVGPAERPWDAERVYRIGATYVFTARRPG